MEENTTQKPNNSNGEKEPRELKETFGDFLRSLSHYLNIREGVDVQATIESIKKDVELKGHNIYVLVFSIFIASIGLNVNSTAVVIGAMLISPLMGPIVGVGLAVGITDGKLLTKSIRSLGVTVVFSVLTATIYFLISPIHEQSHELLARTTPTLLDALVAIFGGFAGIMASSRKEKGNVVPGVAIATALMPPLCTAGYGLATLNFQFFFGAFYLFLLNSIFICLATIIVVRYVRFPRVDFVNPKVERRVKRYVYTFVIIVLIPSGFIFYNVIQESIFRQRATVFIEKHIVSDEIAIINSKLEFSNKGESTIELFLMGERLSEKDKVELEDKMLLEGLQKTKLVIRQDKDMAQDLKQDLTGTLSEQVKSGIIEDMYKKNQEILELRNNKIAELEERLKQVYGDSVPQYVLRRETAAMFPEIERTYFATIETDLTAGVSDTIPTLFVQWKDKVRKRQKAEQREKLQKWLMVRLNMDTVRIVDY
jgi:uncharacterized hydrophobic protein (TIGR00271 family)